MSRPLPRPEFAGTDYVARGPATSRERGPGGRTVRELELLVEAGLSPRAATREADEGSSIRFQAPDGVLTDGRRELVRAHKAELLQMLRQRQRFHYREAALFRLIGHRVPTPQGPGILLRVFRRYCRVELERTGSVVLHQPAEIIRLAVAEFGEAVAA